MNKRAQVYPVVAFFIVLTFLIFWVFFGSELLSIAGQSALDAGAEGIEAFFYSNLNLWILFALIDFIGLIYAGIRQ